MSAIVAYLRPFQCAVEAARQAGVSRDRAVHAVAEAQRAGATGQHITGQLRHMAQRAQRNTHPTPPEAA